MEFIKGMDISFLPEMLDRGAKFADQNGNEREVFGLLKENGVNSIRLRIWNEPENVPESGGYCNLEQTIKMAKKIKENGMSFFLDFHYSDWWADPGKQVKPKAWKELTFDELKNAVYEYTKEVLLSMEVENVFPDMVQIGNEIRSGMLFPDGEVPHFNELVQLVNAGIRGVREVTGSHDTKIVIHLDQGGRYFYLRDWFDQAFAAGLDDFDIIGVSYYPFWHGTFMEFKDTLVNMVNRYGKPIVVAETAHAWRRTEDGFVGEQQEKIAGFPATPEAQQKVIDLVMNITASLDSEMGIGIYYWEPVVIPIDGMGGWCSNMGVFNEKGVALPVLESFKFDRAKINNSIAKIYTPEKIVAEIGNEVNLPQNIKVLYYDGSSKELPVIWEEFDNKTIGNKVIDGMIPTIGQMVQAELQLVEQLEVDHNYIINGDFEGGMEGWNVNCDDERVKIEIHPEFIDPFPAPPVNYMYVESPINFKLEISRGLDDLEPGTYSLQVDYRGTNTTGVDVRLFAETDEYNKREAYIFPTDEKWTTYILSDIIVTNDTCRIGLNMVSPPVFAKIRKFTLTRQKRVSQEEE
jgi:arabinogalactan endo-1,4-beta-galactosidase